MKTLVSFPDSLAPLLKAAAERLKTSKSEVIRLAIADYLAKFSQADDDTALDTSFGVWSEAQARDGLSYQRKFRKEWE